MNHESFPQKESSFFDKFKNIKYAVGWLYAMTSLNANAQEGKIDLDTQHKISAEYMSSLDRNKKEAVEVYQNYEQYLDSTGEEKIVIPAGELTSYTFSKYHDGYELVISVTEHQDSISNTYNEGTGPEKIVEKEVSEYHMYDTNGDGKVDNIEKQEIEQTGERKKQVDISIVGGADTVNADNIYWNGLSQVKSYLEHHKK